MEETRLDRMCFKGNVSQNWAKFKRNFQLYVEAFCAEDIKEKKKVAMFLYAMGDEGQEIYKSFNVKEEDKTVAKIMDKFEKHFVPKANITYERYVFFNRKQKEEESYEQYVTVLRNLSDTCKFGTLKEELVRDIFVGGIKDQQLKEQLLRTEGLTIEKALEAAQVREVSGKQAEALDVRSEIEVVKRRQDTGRGWKCKKCLTEHEFRKCPAYGKECFKCRGPNHFAKACRITGGRDRGTTTMRRRDGATAANSGHYKEGGKKMFKGVREIDTDKYPSDNESANSDHTIETVVKNVNSVNSWYAKLNINGKYLSLKIDSGADCNLMSFEDYLKLGLNKNDIIKTNDHISTYTKQQIVMVGYAKIHCVFKEKMYKIKFYVTEKMYNNVLGLNTCIKLDMLRKVNEISNNVSEKYADLFDNKIGCIDTKVKLVLDKDVKPKISPFRRIPFSIRDDLKRELDRMQEREIIKPIEEPTEWVSNIVIVKKNNGNLRICLDPQQLNRAIKRSHYPLPTLDEMAAKLHGSKYFTKLDANSGYWMVPLNTESSKVCTFQTPFGRYRFLRLPFGLNCSGEIFHRIISQSFENIDGVVTFQDDILIYAEDKETLEKRTLKVLERARVKKIKFNKQKCKFNTREVTFLGHKFGESGMRVDEEKMKGVEQLKAPKDKKSLQRIIGFFNYISKYIPNFSNYTHNMRELLKKDVVFQWNHHLEEELQELKKAVVRSPELRYFNEKEEITLTVDASSKGLGAALIQNQRPVAFASKALTVTEQGYAQIEKELLAVVFGCQKFRQYIYGKKVIIETDHKPLVPISKKPLDKLTPRIKLMMFKLQEYTYELVYKQGKHMYIADTLSRDTENPLEEDNPNNEMQIQVDFITQAMPVGDNVWKIIKEQSIKDNTLTKLKQVIKTGWPKYYRDVPDEVTKDHHLRHDLVISDNIVLINERILIPEGLKTTMLEKLHTGHPGTARTKSRAEKSMYWLGINKDIENFVSKCKVCNKFKPNKQKKELILRETPILPWQEVGMDVFEYERSNYMVVVDYLTNFIEVERLKDLTSNTVIKKTKAVFARHGIPLKVFTDGALYYNSKQFKNFTKEWDFEHIISSPHYAQSNGMAESAVKRIKTLLKKCEEDNSDVYLALLNLRNTKRGKISSPAEML